MGKLNRTGRVLIVFAVFTLLWMGLIFWFSAQDSGNSGNMSGKLLRKVLAVLYPKWKSIGAARRGVLINRLHTLFRKLGHFSEYCVLGILLSATMRRIAQLKTNSRQARPIWTAGLPALLALCYAASDELHQKFVSGRSCELRDVCIDFSGALLGIGLAALAVYIYSRRKNRRKAAPSTNP